MKQIVRYRWYLLLLAAVILPTALAVLFPKFFDTENYENRVFEEFPQFEPEAFKEYPSKLEKWFYDHQPLKNEMVQASATINVGIFRDSPSPIVVLGKDDWLYYADATDGDPIGDYRGRKIYSDEGLSAIGLYMGKAKAYFDERNIPFVVAIAPGKEDLYPEFLPDWVGAHAPDSIDQLKVYMNDMHADIPYLVLEDAFQDFKDHDPYQRNLFAKTDTHWNQFGAYLGAHEIMKAIGVETPDPMQEVTPAYVAKAGDLSVLLGFHNDFYKDVDYEFSTAMDMPYEVLGGSVTSIKYFRADNGGPRVLLVGDSFSILLSSELARSCSELCFYRRGAVEGKSMYQIFEEFQPDVVVYEMADRYTHDVGELLPPE